MGVRYNSLRQPTNVLKESSLQLLFPQEIFKDLLFKIESAHKNGVL